MIPIGINIKEKNILIIGGGNVALRKAKQFLNEGAFLTIISVDFCDEIKKLPINFIKKEYKKMDLERFFLVYTATSNIELNNKIVSYANEKNILVGSATYNENVTFLSMSTYEDENFVLGLTTKQKLPYKKPLIDEISNILQKDSKRINILCLLRDYIIKNILDTKQYFEQIYYLPIELLEFLYYSFENGVGNIYIYHHSNYKENFECTEKNSIFLSLKEFEKYKHIFLYPDFNVIPLVLSEGFIYNKIKNMIPKQWCLKSPLFQDKNDVENIISLYKNKKEKLLCIIHPRNSQDLKNNIKEVLKDDGFVFDFDEEFILNEGEVYNAVIFLMTHGNHFKEVLEKLDNYSNIYNIKFKKEVILDNKDILEYMKNK